jgi:hypothetical protein
MPICYVVFSRFYDFPIGIFIYKGSAAIIGYCGLLTTSECVPFLLSSNDNVCDVTHDIASMIFKEDLNTVPQKNQHKFERNTEEYLT